MAITLAEAKVGMTEKVDQQVIDTFRRSSLLLDMLTFDNAISPGTGGSTLSYGYIQLLTPSTAAVRSINTEYTPGEAKRTEKTSKAVIMGGSFQLDRVVIGTAGAVDELAFQVEQKVKATSNYFNNLVINGKSSTTFDGLDALLTGAETEITSESDLSTSSALDSNYNAYLDEVDGFLSELEEKPDMLLMNSKLLTKMRSAARRAGYYTRSEDAFGKTVEKYNDIIMYDMGKYYNGTNTVDIIETTTATTSAFGMTDMYAIKLSLDAFHGISPQGDKVISSFLPNLTEPGAVKDGDVELIAGVVLKNSNKAGVLRGIAIEPKATASV